MLPIGLGVWGLGAWGFRGLFLLPSRLAGTHAGQLYGFYGFRGLIGLGFLPLAWPYSSARFQAGIHHNGSLPIRFRVQDLGFKVQGLGFRVPKQTEPGLHVDINGWYPPPKKLTFLVTLLVFGVDL